MEKKRDNHAYAYTFFSVPHPQLSRGVKFFCVYNSENLV
jgi:hypothetical protein